MIEDYADKNADATLAAVSDLSAAKLQQFIVFEREHKNRKTVLEPLQDELITVRAPEGGYYGGEWFDEAGERVVRDTTRIRQAAESTPLEIVE